MTWNALAKILLMNTPVDVKIGSEDSKKNGTEVDVPFTPFPI